MATLAGLASLHAVAAAAQAPDTTRPILVLPPLQWDAMGVASHIAVQQTAGDLALLMGGLTFGLTPEAVTQHLPKVGGPLHWADLPPAKEFSDDVRFVRVPMRDMGSQPAPVAACFGEPSSVVLLFHNNALFRISWRFLSDPGCRSPHAAAEALYASYVPLSGALALSTHYRAGAYEVVDVTDPGAEPLLARQGRVRGP